MSVHSPCVLVLHENLLKGFLVVAKLAVHSSKFYSFGQEWIYISSVPVSSRKRGFLHTVTTFPRECYSSSYPGSQKFSRSRRRPRRGAQGTSSQRSFAPSEKSLGPKVSSSQPPLPPPSKIKKQTKTKQKKISQEGIGQSIGYSIPTFSDTLDRRDL